MEKPSPSSPAVLARACLMVAAVLLAGCVEDSTGGETGALVPDPGGVPLTDLPRVEPEETAPGTVGPGEPPGGDLPVPSREVLGEALFHERALSSTGMQSCADCHAAARAFTDPRPGPVSEGAVAGRTGMRNTPTAMYAAAIPPLALRPTPVGERWSGGLFLDGRADSLAEQAIAPLFNPLEMGLVDAADLQARLRSSASADLFRARYGNDSLDGDAEVTLQRVTGAIAAFERSRTLQPATSKFDAVQRGLATFTAQEAQGMELFVRHDKGDCVSCHSMAPPPAGGPAMFTNLHYENIGVPRHPDRRFFAADAVDTGLEATLLGRGVAPARAAAQRGKFRVPTLRNVARTAPYMHNGVFTELRTVVEFYNSRDSDPARWRAIGEPEVPATIEREHTGDRRLSPVEIDALLAFLRTLDDGWFTP